MYKPIETTHLIAQYLAAAAISFLEPQDDDSHTNLGFDAEHFQLRTRPLNDKETVLTFDYRTFALQWAGGPSLSLRQKTHAEIVEWLVQTAAAMGMKDDYKFDLHYELPYTVTDNQSYPTLGRALLSALASNRKNAQLACEQFADELGVALQIRIWPHHFDTGGYSTIPEDANFAVGWGMAVPDTVVNDMYFYISFYKNGRQHLPGVLNPLGSGFWSREGFVGAIMPLSDSGDPLAFFKEAYAAVTKV